MSAMTEPGDAALRRWLLQQLPTDQAAALEEQLLRDDALLDRLRDAETDLLDDFARGALDAADTQAFCAHRLQAPAQRERLRAARAFAHLHAPSLRTPVRRRVAIGFALAASVLAAVVTWQWWPAPQLDAKLPSYTLLAAADRGAGTGKLQLPGTTARVHLQLEVSDPARRYTLSVDTQGQRASLAEHLQPRTLGRYTFVEVDVDVAPLQPGSHRLVLAGQGSGADLEQSWELQIGAR
jgi:hypothetical protein